MALRSEGVEMRATVGFGIKQFRYQSIDLLFALRSGSRSECDFAQRNLSA